MVLNIALILEKNQSLIASKGGARLLANTTSRTDDPQTLRMVAGAIANLCGNGKLMTVIKKWQFALSFLCFHDSISYVVLLFPFRCKITSYKLMQLYLSYDREVACPVEGRRWYYSTPRNG